MKKRINYYTAAAFLWWMAVLAVVLWVEKRFGNVFSSGAGTLIVYSLIMAVIRILSGPMEERSNPVLPPFVRWILGSIIVISISAFMVKSLFFAGKWELLFYFPQWISLLLLTLFLLLYKKKYGHEPPTALSLLGTGFLILISLLLTIQISDIRSVSSMQETLEGEGYTQLDYSGSHDYRILDILCGDDPDLQLPDSFSEHPDGDLREIRTDLYLYSARKDGREFAVLASPVTGRVIAELPLEQYPAYREILHQ